jgi:hypothetical protein
MEKPAQHQRRLDQADKVLARLAMLIAFALDLADAKAMTNQRAEIDSTHDHLAPRLAGPQLDAMLRAELFERLGLDQSDVACVAIVEVAISLETPSRMSDRRGHLVRLLTVHAGQEDRFDFAARFTHHALLSPHHAARLPCDRGQHDQPRGRVFG